jgi:hypothetical protein
MRDSCLVACWPGILKCDVMDWRRVVACEDVVAVVKMNVKRRRKCCWVGGEKVYECRRGSSGDGIDRQLSGAKGAPRSSQLGTNLELAGRARASHQPHH